MKIYYYLLFFLILSCGSNEKSSENNIKEIKINLSDIEEDKELFNDTFKLKKWIKLESNKSFTLSGLASVLFSKDRIFISDDRNKLYILDSIGNLINPVLSGKGPGEYLYVSDIQYEETKQELYVADDMSEKMLVYDKNGVFRRELDLPIPVNNFFIINSKKIAVSTNFNTNSNTKNDEKSFNRLFILELIDGDWIIKFKGLPFSKKLSKYITSWKFTTKFCNTKQGLLFIPPFDTSIYKYNENKDVFSKITHFDFGKNQIPDDYINKTGLRRIFKRLKDEEYIHGWENFYINDDLFCFMTGVLNDEETIVYNNKTKRITKQENLIDIENSLPIHIFPNIMSNDLLLTVANPTEIHKLKDKKEESLGMKFSRETNELDNPILLLYERK